MTQKKHKEEEQVQEVSLDLLHPFQGHPFKVLEDEKMEQTVESVRQFGVINPAIARPRGESGYELISGHRRHRACQLAGLETMPVLIRDLDDDAAAILLVDSNLQREGLLPSERAFAYKMKLDSINRIKGRPKKVGQVVPDYFGKRSTEIVAEGTDESYKQIQRYIRLTHLIPPLLDLVDEKKIGLNPAYELSYLTQEEQKGVLEAIDYAQATPSLSQAQRMKRFSQEGRCSLDVMCAILSEEKKGDLDRVTLKNEVLRKYFPKSYTPRQMEQTILQLLEQWQRRRQREMTR